MGASVSYFRGEQRAIGEKMIREVNGSAECIGYAAFLEAEFGKTSPLIDCLREDVRSLTRGIEAASARIIAIQNSLIDLLTFLDPACVRFPAIRRTTLRAA